MEPWNDLWKVLPGHRLREDAETRECSPGRSAHLQMTTPKLGALRHRQQGPVTSQRDGVDKRDGGRHEKEGIYVYF